MPDAGAMLSHATPRMRTRYDHRVWDSKKARGSLAIASVRAAIKRAGR